MVIIHWDILSMAVENLLNFSPRIDFQELSFIANTGSDIVLI